MNLNHLGVINKVSQIEKIPCGRSDELKYGQGVCLGKIWDEFEFCSPGVIKVNRSN